MLRRILALLLVTSTLAMFGVNVWIVYGQWWYGTTIIWANADHPAGPLISFEANVKAWNIIPWDPRVRRQFILSLANLQARYGAQVQLQPEAADRIYEVARTVAPHNPGTLLARASYLLTSGRWGNGEIDPLLARLRRWAPSLAGVWLVDGVYALQSGDLDRAEASASRGLAITPISDFHRGRLGKLAALIEEKRQ